MRLKLKLAAITSAMALAAGLGLAFAGPVAASAGTASVAALRAAPDYISGDFSLVNDKSGDCLGIHNGSTDDGYAQQQDCTFSGSQVWYFNGNTSAAGYEQLQNEAAQADHQCLSVQDGSTAINTQLTGYTCKSSSDRPDQFWGDTQITGTNCYLFYSYITENLTAGVSGASDAEYADVINANPDNTTGDGVEADEWCIQPVS